MPAIKQILVVEDQRGPRSTFEWAFGLTLPNVAPDAAVSYAQSVQGACRLLKQPQKFDVVFLDHRLPRVDTGDLESRDFDAFCARLENAGYYMIPEIRRSQPHAVIVGTSSMASELSRLPHKPDEQITKVSTEFLSDLELLLRRISAAAPRNQDDFSDK